MIMFQLILRYLFVLQIRGKVYKKMKGKLTFQCSSKKEFLEVECKECKYKELKVKYEF